MIFVSGQLEFFRQIPPARRQRCAAKSTIMTDSAHALSQLTRAVPLLGKALADPGVGIVERAIDNYWLYDTSSTASVGWNPFRAEIYIGRHSLTAELLRSPQSDLRLHNEADLLMPEIMFVVHDYLHIWATDLIRRLRPELEFGVGPISPDNLEDHAFALLVTEAAATVGLDYWWLSHHPIDEHLEIGSAFETLTVSYQTRYLREYQRFCPELEVQQASFFELIARFYADGVFPGFSVADLQQSPRTLRWLRHELGYGATQRTYARRWLHYLAGLPLEYRVDQARPFDCEAPWRRQLIREVGERLWALVKTDAVDPIEAGFDPESSWAAPRGRPLDFRFANALAFSEDELALDVRHRELGESELRFFADQLLRTRQYPRGDDIGEAAIQRARQCNSAALILWTARQLPVVDANLDSSTGVRDMFFLK